MLPAQAQWLPQFHGKSIQVTPIIDIPQDIKPAPVPVDPALEILVRFGELAE